MIYIQIKAGLGNQMFEYAFGRALSLEQGKPLALDLSWYDNHAGRDTPRKYLLDKYNIQARIAVPREIEKFNTPLKKLLRKIYRRLVYKKDNVYRASLMKSRGSYFEGHWANERFFKKHKDVIRADLSLKYPLTAFSSSVLSEIKTYKEKGFATVSVHVRRGDCVTNPHAASYQGTVDTSYYDKSYEYLVEKFGEEKLVFFIFSDDIEWARANVLTKAKTTCVSRPEIPDYEELYLMTQCDNHVIANSTFSWWGAWLNANPDKIVIAPKQWLKDTSFDTSDVCPKEWVRI
ncbi:MAG: alpha-1,2-fucosyltransferase [Patescibacteria group bacterium]